jgi:DNA-directed RNA polymerase subunit beta'|uniref:DNA-directed RNA polymerase subunit beta' n=1 Tax=Cyclotella sp. WC03_2 TaxID=1549164 RepID=A0A089X779_9STRA|nr:RNA polymerase beta [Cyclotella sp. WC03_2]
MIRSEKEFDYIKIKLASPMRILQWSHRKLPNGQFVGEVQKSETINYRTFKPEMDGLFCERIFGPSKSLECACGKYKRVRYEGLICERCGVELTESRVRRHRMGHINLIYPVTHVWYTNSRPNYIALLLEVEQCEKRLDTGWIEYANIRNLKEKDSKDIPDSISSEIDCRNYLSSPKAIFNCKEFLKGIGKQKKSNLVNFYDERIKRIKLASLAYFIAEDEIAFYGLHWDLQQYRRCRELGFTGYPLKPHSKFHNRRRNTPKYLLRATPNYLIGAVLIKRELEKLNLDQEIMKTRNFIMLCSKLLHQVYNFSYRKWEYQRIYKLRDQSIKRIRILENLLTTGANPAWMIITILPVIPPALRPMIQLEGGRFATSDLNELYRRIITRNNRLLRLLEIDAPQLIIRNEKRMLQEAVDTLIDNGKRGKIALSASNRPLKSLSDIIKGKHGRFRQNLLGKRVDYSGRSVIVVGPSLKLNQCGLPYEMAIELFQPFIIRELINQGLASNMKVAKNLLQQNESIINRVLEKVLANHPIFLNRAPTLHRLGIQAFQPIIVQGRAIKLHPLVCSAFNADFDGDQMAVHVPLSIEAQAECYMLMLAPYNFLSPANSEPIIMPSQDMVLGCYYLTINNIPGLLGSNHYFADLNDVILAYNQDQIEIHTAIWVRYKNKIAKPLNFIKIIQLKDGSYIEYYENIQIRKDKNNKIIVQYIQTTTGRVLLNYIIQTTLNLKP